MNRVFKIIFSGLLFLLLGFSSFAQTNEATRLLEEQNIPITKQQMIESSQTGDSTTVSLLLQAGVNPNFGIGDFKTSPLHAATIMGHLDVVKLLVENDAKINKAYSDYYTATPFWYAVNNGDLEIVKYLLENGADPMVENRDGWTPIRQARQHNYPEIIQLLEQEIKNRN